MNGVEISTFGVEQVLSHIKCATTSLKLEVVFDQRGLEAAKKQLEAESVRLDENIASTGILPAGRRFTAAVRKGESRTYGIAISGGAGTPETFIMVKMVTPGGGIRCCGNLQR